MGRRNKDKRKGSAEKKQSPPPPPPPEEGRRDKAWEGPIPADAVKQFDTFLQSRRSDSRLEEGHTHHEPNYPRAPTPPREKLNSQVVEDAEQQGPGDGEQSSSTACYNPETSPVSAPTEEEPAPDMVRTLSEQIARGELKMTRYVGLYTFQDRSGSKQHVTAAVDLVPPSELQMGGRMVPLHRVLEAAPSAPEEHSQGAEESGANEAQLAALEGRTIASVAEYLREAEEASPQQDQGLSESGQSTQPHLPVLFVPVAEPLNQPYSQVDVTPVYSGDIYEQHYAQPHAPSPACTAFHHPSYSYQMPVIVQPQAMDLRYYQNPNDAGYTNVSWSDYSKCAESGPGYYGHLHPQMAAGHGYPAWDLIHNPQRPVDPCFSPHTYVPEAVGPAPYAPPVYYGGHFYALGEPTPRPRATHGRKSRGKSGEGRPQQPVSPPPSGIYGPAPWSRPPFLAQAGCYRPWLEPETRNMGPGICGPFPTAYQAPPPPFPQAYQSTPPPPFPHAYQSTPPPPYPQAYQSPPSPPGLRPAAPAVGNPPPASPWVYDRRTSTPRPLLGAGRPVTKKVVNVYNDKEDEPRPQKEGRNSNNGGAENKTSSTPTDKVGQGKEEGAEVAQSSSPPKKYTKTTGSFRKRGLRGWRRDGGGNQGDNVLSGAEGVTSRRISGDGGGGFHRPWMAPDKEPGPSGDQRTE